MISRPLVSMSVSTRPWVSTTPITTSPASTRRCRASFSISYVLPTPGAAPRKILRRPRPLLSACFSRASGDGRAASSVIPQSSSSLARAHGVQRQVQLQHIDMRLADNAQETSFDVVVDQLVHGGFGKPSRLRYARHLEIGGGWRDVGVEAAGRGG